MVNISLNSRLQAQLTVDNLHIRQVLLPSVITMGMGGGQGANVGIPGSTAYWKQLNLPELSLMFVIQFVGIWPKNLDC